jgi:hypothetical protein
MAKENLLEEFVSRQFAIRDAAHRAHWTTDSGYQHTVLGEFYDGVIEQADALVEASVAAFGDKPKSDSDVVQKIRAEMIWLIENREKLAREVPAIENIVDEVCKFYLAELFKLENLK